MDTQSLPILPATDEATDTVNLPITEDAVTSENNVTDENAERRAEHEIQVSHNISIALAIFASAIALVVTSFVFYGVWQGNPFVAFGLYVIPLTVAVLKIFKAFKPYGIMTLLIGLSMFAFLWGHNVAGLISAFIFGAVTIAIYMLCKYLDLRDERLHANIVNNRSQAMQRPHITY